MQQGAERGAQAALQLGELQTRLFLQKGLERRAVDTLEALRWEDERGLRACAKLEAVIPEPASAATIAAAAKLHREGVIGDSDRTVCVLTGSGLRDLKLFAREGVQVPQVQPGDMDALRRAVAFYQEENHDA